MRCGRQDQAFWPDPQEHQLPDNLGLFTISLVHSVLKGSLAHPKSGSIIHQNPGVAWAPTACSGVSPARSVTRGEEEEVIRPYTGILLMG